MGPVNLGNIGLKELMADDATVEGSMIDGVIMGGGERPLRELVAAGHDGQRQGPL